MYHPEPASGTYTRTPEPSKTCRNLANLPLEPASGTTNTPEPSETLRNLEPASGTYTGTPCPKLPEPASGTDTSTPKFSSPPEPASRTETSTHGTLRNQPAPATRTGTHRSLSEDPISLRCWGKNGRVSGLAETPTSFIHLSHWEHATAIAMHAIDVDLQPNAGKVPGLLSRFGTGVFSLC